MAPERQSDVATSLARAAGRLSSDKALRKRILQAGVSGAAATVRSVSRVVRKLLLEMTGFLFICLAMIGGAEVLRKWHTHETARLAAAAVFSVMFLYFGVSSFWKVKSAQHRDHGELRERKGKSNKTINPKVGRHGERK